MGTYIIRVAKYVVYFAILLSLTVILMNSFSSNKIVLAQYYNMHGLMLCGVVLLFSLIYPFIGFVKKDLTFNAPQRKEDLIRVMSACGYTQTGGDDNNMEFRATSTAKKLAHRWDDKITITTDADGLSVMSGPRKEVVRATFRFNTYL